MRLWSLHPRYLDPRGIVALWREGLLARKVLLGQTKGYRNHPQLQRFRGERDPVAAIDAYLKAVLDEAVIRGYAFDRTKIPDHCPAAAIPVTRGQLAYEWRHLLGKLKERSPDRMALAEGVVMPEPHPLFRLVDGDVEPWEVIKEKP